MNLAAAAGGAATRAALDRLGQWWTQPVAPPTPQQPFNMGPMMVALPRGRGRGRGRRGRGRGRRPQAGRTGGQPSAGISTRSGAVIVVKDTEILGTPDGTLQTFTMNPSGGSLARLSGHEKMYHRYRIRYMNVAFKSGSGTATAGNVAVGVCVGPKIASVSEQAHVMTLRPSFYVPAWKNASLSVGSDIDLGRYMVCGDSSADGVAFTIYVFGTKGVGVVQVSYEVEFSHPNPF